eukprot:SAG31_NODE_3815_length_3856_cov_4.700027_1_plen_222_part_00
MSLTNPPGRTYLHYLHVPEFRFGWGLSYHAWKISTASNLHPKSTPRRIRTAESGTQQRLEFTVKIERLLEDRSGAAEVQQPARQTVLCFWRLRRLGFGNESTRTSNFNRDMPDLHDHGKHNGGVVFPSKKLFDYGGVDNVRAGETGFVTCTLDGEDHLAVASTGSDGARVLWPGEYEVFATLGSATALHEEAATIVDTVARFESVILEGSPHTVEPGLRKL